MFRTVSVHLQEQPFYKLYVVFGLCRYHKSGCCVAIATQQPDVWNRHIPAYTKCDIQLIKVAADDGLIPSETCRAYIEK